MESFSEGQIPSSLEGVEDLVLQLYQPGASEKVGKTQEALQNLQRSPEGWQLANSLLGNEAESVRFFGALTFIVKLNTDSKSLSDDDAEALLQTLIGWLIRRLENGEGALVVRKLCSTLVAYFLQFSIAWNKCVKHLMYCLCSGQAIRYGELDDSPNTMILVQRLAPEQAVVIFWFASNLVEEVGKTDSNSMKQHKFHDHVVPNADDIVPLIERYISVDPSGAGTRVRQEAMKCFQAWVSYSHRAFVDDEIIVDPLRTLTHSAIMCLPDDSLYETTVELFSDVLTNYSKFLQKDDFTLLRSIFNSPWSQERYERLVNGDFDFDSVQFGHFMLAFGDATVGDLIKHVHTDAQGQQFLSALCGLLSAEGYAVQEDKIFVPALEFWNTLVETMLDYRYSETGTHAPWLKASMEHVMLAIRKCWKKMQFPATDVFRSWDSVDRTGFKDARRDVGDIIENYYLITGIQILDVFVDLSQQSIITGNWAELEASLYCLALFADCVSSDERCDEYLHKVFDPPLLSIFSNPPTDFPVQTMKTFLSLFSGYAEYFQRHADSLPIALNIAFGAISTPVLAKSASHTIVKLCSDCRTVLVPQLGAFLQQFNNMTHASLDSNVKEGIMEGIASIIQALPDDKFKVEPLGQLLCFVEADLEQCLRLISEGPSQTATSNASDASSPYGTASELGLRTLRYLVSIAKGIQVPIDKPVDLEKKTTASPFWTIGEGSVVQQRIISIMVKTYDALYYRSDIIDSTCHVFRCGFVEHEAGPFVFPPRFVAQFLCKAGPQTPQLGTVIKTACSLVSSYRSVDRIDELVNALLNWITELLYHLGEPKNDPEISQNGIDFIYRLIPDYLGLLLNHQSSSLEFLFIFILKALTGSDPLPKIAAADFWTAFVGLPNQGPPLQESIENALVQLGPLLAQALIYNIGGNASRSELDKLSEPVKKLVVRQVRSKSWFEAALFGDSFPSDTVTAKQKTIFLQRITNLRGARGTNQVVRDFWLAARGSNFAYAS